MVNNGVSSTTERVLAALSIITRALAAEIRRAGASVQLTLGQFFTLRLLAKADRSVSEVARILRVAMPTVTQSTDSLTSKGLIERYADERDRRQVWLRITPEGKQLLKDCTRSVEGYLAEVLSAWPQGRQEELTRVLEGLVRLTEEHDLVQQP